MLCVLVNIGFQVLFHSPPGVLFTFPSRYWFTIGHQVVFSLGGWSLQLPTGFHVSRGTQDTAISILVFIYRGVTFCAGPFQTSSTNYPFKCRSPTTPVINHWFGLFPLRSPLLRKSSFLSLPPGTKMFQFPGFASITYVFSYGYQNVTSGGFPHSDITGSTLACSSPMLFAAYHVLRRLLVPRHPPYALSSLTFHRLYV